MKYLAIYFLVVLSGCAQLSSLGLKPKEGREFVVDRAWVTNNLQTKNHAFRKINRFNPILFENLIIQANAIDGISAIDKDTKQIVWTLEIQNGIEAPGVLFKDRIYFGANNGNFYSITAKDGKINWTFPTRVETLSEPTLLDGMIYFLGGNNTLYALDATNGKQLWLYNRQDPSMISIRGGSKPTIKNNLIYVGFSDGALVAIHANNGTVKWEKFLNKGKRFRDIDSNPVIDGDKIYVSGYDDNLYCLTLDGDILWKKEGGGYGGIFISGDRLFYGNTSGQFLALNKTTGQAYWTHQISDGVATQAQITKGLVVYGESLGKLVFLDAISGKKMGTYEPGRGIFSKPTLDEQNQIAYFISNEGNIHAVKYYWGSKKAFDWMM